MAIDKNINFPTYIKKLVFMWKQRKESKRWAKKPQQIHITLILKQENTF